jgi:hypothetical protein
MNVSRNLIEIPKNNKNPALVRKVTKQSRKKVGGKHKTSDGSII